MNSRQARDALSRLVESWQELWAPKWVKEVVDARRPSDLDSEAIQEVMADVRRLLDHLGRVGASGISRTELAVNVLADPHALDEGTKVEGAMTQALRYREHGFELDKRELWQRAGIRASRVSAPVLTWSLPVVGGSFLDEQIRSASAGALPLHISLFALQKHPVTVPHDARILVVENPRLVEAAAERELPSCVITTNGSPTTAVKTLLEQLRESGASVWFHGDFDSWGIGICCRMYEDGATPWMMDAPDYEAALDRAEQAGIRLVQDSNDCCDTPWDPDLQAAFQRRGQRIIHEEFVLDSVLGQFTTKAL